MYFAFVLFMVPPFFQIQNSRTLQGLSRTSQYFEGPFSCMVKKWFADYTYKFRPEGMKKGNIQVYITLFIKFRK